MAVAPHIAFLQNLPSATPLALQTAQREYEAALSAANDTRSVLEDAIADAENIRQKAREASGSNGVSQFTTDFAEEAKQNAKEARVWLSVSIVFLILVFALIGLSQYLFAIPISATNAQIAQSVINKTLLIGTALAATVWCSRMYRTSKHLAAVNSHRSQALKTFQAFVAASIDPSTKDAVLIETTRSIFSHASTGYVTEASGSATDGTQVIELIRSAAGHSR